MFGAMTAVAAPEGGVHALLTSPGSELGDGLHYVTNDVTITASDGKSALKVASGKTAAIYIQKGVTLTVIGGNADGTTGAGVGLALTRSGGEPQTFPARLASARPRGRGPYIPSPRSVSSSTPCTDRIQRLSHCTCVSVGKCGNILSSKCRKCLIVLNKERQLYANCRFSGSHDGVARLGGDLSG